ncbi:MAG: hypothetical protein JST92_20560, partial [Deltaproteobacteria bacterium]|nr:hypothetical protein [Deltaproteobacteria bacterium]
APSSALFATAIDPLTGNPVLAVYDNVNNNGQVLVYKCTSNCNGPAPATWQQIGSAVDTNLGILTWNDAEDPRPVSVAVDSSGTIWVAYQSTTAPTSGMPPCSAILANNLGPSGSWSAISADAAAFAGVFGGSPPAYNCTADGAEGSNVRDQGRWISVTVGPTFGPEIAFGGSTGDGTSRVFAQPCTSNCSGQPASTMTFFANGARDADSFTEHVGRWVSMSAFDGNQSRLLYQHSSLLRYSEFVYGLSSSGAAVGAFPAYASMAHDGTSTAIAYYDTNASKAQLSTCTTASCSSFTGRLVDISGDDTGRYASVAIGQGQSTAVISYYDVQTDLLMLASTPVSSLTTPTSIPIAYGATGSSISATGAGNARLIYTTNNGTQFKSFAQ